MSNDLMTWKMTRKFIANISAMHCFTQTELQKSWHISHGNDLINWLENLIVIHNISIVNIVNIRKYSEFCDVQVTKSHLLI